jgi:hypothetical protein
MSPESTGFVGWCHATPKIKAIVIANPLRITWRVMGTASRGSQTSPAEDGPEEDRSDEERAVAADVEHAEDGQYGTAGGRHQLIEVRRGTPRNRLLRDRREHRRGDEGEHAIEWGLPALAKLADRGLVERAEARWAIQEDRARHQAKT